jgi:hypothetical protein
VLPESAFPGPLPLGRDGGLELLARPDDYRRPGGAFLTFVMVPTAARFGDWLFAGVSRSLADAADRVEEFIAALGGTAEDGTTLLRYLLGPKGYAAYESWHFPDLSPIEGLGSHRVVLYVEAEAPHDDTGVCIVEVPSPDESATGDFAELAVAGWREEAIARLLTAGTRLWGPPPPDVQAALEQRSGPDDWTRWSQSEWGENPDWSLSEERTGPNGWGQVLRPHTA